MLYDNRFNQFNLTFYIYKQRFQIVNIKFILEIYFIVRFSYLWNAQKFIHSPNSYCLKCLKYHFNKHV